jgi:hypothetical protein
MKNLIIITLTIITFLFSSLSVLADDKLKAEEIIAKHLDSIGTKEKREGIKNRTFTSQIQFSYVGSPTVTIGRGVLASEGEKNLWGMILNSNDYPQDRFSYNGDEVKVAFIKPGVYSVLGDFIFSNRGLLRDGLLGGALFSSWALNSNETRQGKISNAGTKKFGSMETYAISYSPKNALDLEVKLFFEKETFRHVRTTYSKVIAARQAPTIDASAGQSSDRLSVTEEFSDFQKLDGLTLPSRYSLTHIYYNNSPIQATKRTNREVRWDFKITNFSYNQQLDADSFNIQTN